MSLNSTPAASRIHIGFFGRRNAGKSSLINAVTGQNLSIVSDVKGTTTDPVYKAMELLPLGPVMLIDTPGLDDEGELGALRVEKALQVLRKTDIAVLVLDSRAGKTAEDEAILSEIRSRNLPHILVYNKADLLETPLALSEGEIAVSTLTGMGIHQLKEKLAALAPKEAEKRIVGDLLAPGDLVVLVTPIDSSAPKGRLILPQQQTIRDILDANAVSIVVKETELTGTLAALAKKPALVITDSQAFKAVSADTPADIPLTSFSILMARYKGGLARAYAGARVVDTLKDGDRVLISEGCTHHRQCEDIGTVKLPRWIREYTGAEPAFTFTSGTEFPKDLSEYKLIVHCGGCMLNEKEMQSRGAQSKAQGVPMTNYGILIAHMQGILARSIRPFPEFADLL